MQRSQENKMDGDSQKGKVIVTASSGPPAQWTRTDGEKNSPRHSVR